jgi:hypothetical protein
MMYTNLNIVFLLISKDGITTHLRYRSMYNLNNNKIKVYRHWCTLAVQSFGGILRLFYLALSCVV